MVFIIVKLKTLITLIRQYVVIGGNESGFDAAYQLAKMALISHFILAQPV